MRLPGRFVGDVNLRDLFQRYHDCRWVLHCYCDCFVCRPPHGCEALLERSNDAEECPQVDARYMFFLAK